MDEVEDKGFREGHPRVVSRRERGHQGLSQANRVGGYAVAQSAAIDAAGQRVELARARIGPGPLVIMMSGGRSPPSANVPDAEGAQTVWTPLHAPEISESVPLSFGGKLGERHLDEKPPGPERGAEESALQSAAKTTRRQLRKRA